MGRTLLLWALVVVGVAAVQSSASLAAEDGASMGPTVDEQSDMSDLGEIQDSHDDENDREQYPANVDSDGIPNHYTPVDFDSVKEHITSPLPHTFWHFVGSKKMVSLTR